MANAGPHAGGGGIVLENGITTYWTAEGTKSWPLRRSQWPYGQLGTDVNWTGLDDSSMCDS